MNEWKGTDTRADWTHAHIATPSFYRTANGTPLGTIAVKEGTETVLLKNPQNEYRVDGKEVTEWKMILIGTSEETMIEDRDYYKALRNIEKYTIDTKEDFILIKGLTFHELQSIRG